MLVTVGTSQPISMALHFLKIVIKPHAMIMGWIRCGWGIIMLSGVKVQLWCAILLWVLMCLLNLALPVFQLTSFPCKCSVTLLTSVHALPPDRSGIFKIPVQVVRHPVNISPRITRPVRKLSAIVWNTLFGRYFVHPHKKKKRWSLRVGPLRFLHPPYALPDRPWGA